MFRQFKEKNKNLLRLNLLFINLLLMIQFENDFFSITTSVDTEMCCPKGKCGCQYFILLT
jgi:hypothetical protein